jgi:23S rRNA (guanosine2251-2'-O)-methyltransferase
MMTSGSETLAGRNSVREALLSRRRVVHQVILGEGVGEKGIVEEIARLAREAGVPVERARRQEMDRWGADLKTQGVIARVSGYPYAEIDDLLAVSQERGEPPFLLVLDSLQDPQNVGSLLRTAEAVGVHGVILPERRAVGVTPAVSRASAGAVEWLRVAMVTNLARTLDTLKEAGVWVVGVEDLPEAQDYRRVDLNMPLALVVGSEGRGTRRLIAEKCDLLVRIPMRGHINSLNVSVAGSLMLYQAWNARNQKS